MPVRLASLLPPAFVSVAAAAALPLVPHTTVVAQEPAVDDAHVTPAVPVGHAALAALDTYTVRAGDTLAAVAGRVCGDPADYWALAYNNGVPNPDLIYAGQVFKVACQAAAQAIASRYGLMGSSPGSPQASSPVHYAAQPSAAPQQPVSRPVVTSVSGTIGSSSMQQCIIAAESGGNPQVMNASGHYGLFQFSSSMWSAHGGNPADFGHASVAEQVQVYDNTVAADGYSDWAPYDGC